MEEHVCNEPRVERNECEAADCDRNHRLVQRARRLYTRVKKSGYFWACYLQIDHQRFCVVDDVDKETADWFAGQLAKALARMIAKVKDGEPGGKPDADLD